jgi:N-acetylmuramoyl-L-alanine amidase
MPIKKTLKVFLATAGLIFPIENFSELINIGTHKRLVSSSGLEHLLTGSTDSRSSTNSTDSIASPNFHQQKKNSEDNSSADASYKKKTIILDPGHGGYDPGAVNGNIHESDITMAQALKVKEILQNRGYTNVLLTRDSDNFIGLDNRTKFETDNSANLFVSFHCDSVDNPNARGFTVYTSGSVNSNILGESISSELERGLKRSGRFHSNRGVRKSGYRVVIKTKSPAALIECGYLRNPDDLSTMTDTTDDIEHSVADGIELYLKLPDEIRKQCKPYDKIIEQKTREFSQRLGYKLDSDLVRAVLFRESPKGETVDPMQVDDNGVSHAYRALKNRKEHTELLGDFSKLDNTKLEDNIEAGIAWLFHKAAVYDERVVEDDKEFTYVVQKGDTSYHKIAKRIGTTVDTIKRLNPNVNPNKMDIGKTELKVKYSRKEWYIKDWKNWEDAVGRYGPQGKPDYADEVMAYYEMIKN